MIYVHSIFFPLVYFHNVSVNLNYVDKTYYSEYSDYSIEHYSCIVHVIPNKHQLINV